MYEDAPAPLSAALGTRISLLICVCLALASTGCDTATPAMAAGDREPLRVERGEWVDRLLLTGEMVADDAAVLVVPNANIWPVSVRWLVEDGAEVKEGDRVAEFDGSQLSSQLENLESSLISALSRLAGTRNDAASKVDSARFDLARKQAAFDKAKLLADVPDGLLAEQVHAQRRLDLDKASLELKQAEAALESASDAGQRGVAVEEIAVRKARRELERAARGLQALTLVAPRDGIALVALNRREGRPFQTGDNAYPGLGVVTLPKLESMRVEAQLFDVDDGRVRPGLPVVATLDAFPDWRIAGQVRSVDSIADEAGQRSTRRRFRVAVDLEEIDTERMRPGMSAKIEVQTTPRPALLAPRAAIEWDGDQAALRLRGGSLEKIELGACNPSVCEVLSGADEGTRLASAQGDRS